MASLQITPDNQANVEVTGKDPGISPGTSPGKAPRKTARKAPKKGTQKTAVLIIEDNPVGSSSASELTPLVREDPDDTPATSTKETMIHPSATDYEEFTHREQIYHCCGMYLGSDEKIPTDEWLLDIQTRKMVKKTITLPQAVERAFLEILSNAYDNVGKSRSRGLEPGSISVTMDRSTVSIRNGGLPIPIQIHPKHNIYTPEMILGRLLTSSNYHGDRKGVGQNGLGAKLVNIYSKRFMVEVGDPLNGLHYVQIWNNNMTMRDDPVLESYEGEPFVHITYVLDFERFGYTEYPDEVFYLFARHCADASFNCKVPIFFNNLPLSVQSIEDYTTLYFPKDDEESPRLIHYEWPGGIPLNLRKNGLRVAKDLTTIPLVELCIIDTPRCGEVISFVNGLMTKDGGVHVNAAIKAITDGVLNLLNLKKPKTSKKKGRKGNKLNKNPKKETEKNKNVRITVQDVKPHLSIVLSCRLINPKYNSQSKNFLTSPAVDFNFSPDLFEAMASWQLINCLYATIDMRNFNKMKATDGRKRRFIGIEKLDDANLAGTKKASMCTLYVVEGKSASSYPTKMRSLDPKGTDYFGIYPMKGKPLNVLHAMHTDRTRIAQNQELMDLKEALGLREGLDYLDPANFNTLRYGCIIILADADDDGKHIIGLMLLLFHCLYPSLLTKGYVFILRTPVLRLTHGNERLKFYSIQQYEEWKLITADHKKWSLKYYKGLGSSKEIDIKDDSISPHIITCIYDDSSTDAFNLVFDEKMADERKEWIANWKHVLDVESIVMLPISTFIRHEVVQYSIANIRRSIPRLLDGLKVSQRKVVWAAIQKNGNKKKPIEMKVAQLAAHAAEVTQYHHGENSLVEAIKTMTQNFIGKNNMSIFSPEAQFGTRYRGGSDCAEPRYTYVKLMWWIPFVFRKEDTPLLKRVVEEGKPAEPEIFLPIIPLALINGTRGVATAHSTFSPNHNPLDVCKCLRAKIKGEELPELIPWYRGFTGEISLEVRTNEKKVDKKNTTEDPEKGSDDAPSEHSTDAPPSPNPSFDDLQETNVPEKKSELRQRLEENDPDIVDEDNSAPGHTVLITKGHFYCEGNKVIVDELPIGRWTHDYDKWLESLVLDKVITNKRKLSKHDTVRFEITGLKNPSLNRLRLTKSYGMNNMVLLDSQNIPSKYKDASNLLESFYEERLPYYEVRRQHILEAIQTDIDEYEHKIRFIRAVIAKKIIFMNRSKKDVHAQMQKFSIPLELLSSTRMSNFTEDEIKELEGKISKLTEKKNSHQKTTGSQLWLQDLDEFVVAYSRNYKCSVVEFNPDKIPVLHSVDDDEDDDDE